eukprot:4367124-Pyramimonas_sp.AAC.1
MLGDRVHIQAIADMSVHMNGAQRRLAVLALGGLDVIQPTLLDKSTDVVGVALVSGKLHPVCSWRL